MDFSLFAEAPKAGKSAFMEWIDHEVRAEENVRCLALEYNFSMLNLRFESIPQLVSKFLLRETS